MNAKLKAYKHINPAVLQRTTRKTADERRARIASARLTQHKRPGQRSQQQPRVQANRGRRCWLFVHAVLLFLSAYPALRFFTRGAAQLAPATRDVTTGMTIGFLCTLYAGLTNDNAVGMRVAMTVIAALLIIVVPVAAYLL